MQAIEKYFSSLWADGTLSAKFFSDEKDITPIVVADIKATKPQSKTTTAFPLTVPTHDRLFNQLSPNIKSRQTTITM